MLRVRKGLSEASQMYFNSLSRQRSPPTVPVAVPSHRVVPSSTLSSNRCLGIAFLSRADREIAVFRHVAPPSRLCLEFPRETASSEVRGEGREPLADKAGIQVPGNRITGYS